MNYKDRIMLLLKGSKDGNAVTTESKPKKFREKKITRLHLILAGLVVIAVLVLYIDL